MIKKISNILLMLLIGFFPGVLFPGNNSITKIGEWGTGNYLDVAVQNHYAYCAAGYAGLDIIDIGNPSLPKKTGNYNTPGLAISVFVMGNYAYVADLLEGLQVIDVSSPTSPVAKGDFDTPGSAEGVYVNGNYAYVANSQGLQLIDVSNPSSPTLAGSIDTGGSAWDVYVSGNYAYIANFEEEVMQIIDIWRHRYAYTGRQRCRQ